jgi:hypothetical protein
MRLLVVNFLGNFLSFLPLTQLSDNHQSTSELTLRFGASFHLAMFRPLQYFSNIFDGREFPYFYLLFLLNPFAHDIFLDSPSPLSELLVKSLVKFPDIYY